LGKPCRCHQVSDAYTVITTLAKQRGRGLHDVRAIGLGLLFRDFHRPPETYPYRPQAYIDVDQHQNVDFLDFGRNH
jgi:hypothetical protein